MGRHDITIRFRINSQTELQINTERMAVVVLNYC